MPQPQRKPQTQFNGQFAQPQMVRRPNVVRNNRRYAEIDLDVDIHPLTTDVFESSSLLRKVLMTVALIAIVAGISLIGTESLRIMQVKQSATTQTKSGKKTSMLEYTTPSLAQSNPVEVRKLTTNLQYGEVRAHV